MTLDSDVDIMGECSDVNIIDLDSGNCLAHATSSADIHCHVPWIKKPNLLVLSCTVFCQDLPAKSQLESNSHYYSATQTKLFLVSSP